MSDVEASPKVVEELENPNANAAAAFGSQLDEIADALAILYIKNNASGRHKFNDKWPDIAQYVFGETLIKYDYEGTKDRKHRAELEEEADQRRVLLKKTIREMVEKSVDAGMLQFDYVGQVIDQFGPDLSPYLYAEKVIERVRPGLLEKRKTEKDSDDQAKSDASDLADEDIRSKERASHNPEESLYDDQKLSAEENEILSNADDQYEAVKPIELSDSIETPREGIKEDVSLPGDEEARAEQEDEKEAEEEKAESQAQDKLPERTRPSDLDDLDHIRPIETQTLVDSSKVEKETPEPPQVSNPTPELPASTQAGNPAPEVKAEAAADAPNPAPEIPAPEAKAEAPNPAPDIKASNPAPDITSDAAAEKPNPAPELPKAEESANPAPEVKVEPVQPAAVVEDVPPVKVEDAPPAGVEDAQANTTPTPQAPSTAPLDVTKDVDVAKSAPPPAIDPKPSEGEAVKPTETPKVDTPAAAPKDENKGAAAPSVFHRKLAEKPKKPKGFYMDIFNGLAKETK